MELLGLNPHLTEPIATESVMATPKIKASVVKQSSLFKSSKQHSPIELEKSGNDDEMESISSDEDQRLEPSFPVQQPLSSMMHCKSKKLNSDCNSFILL